ncbi:hypothetical protein LTR99_003357 [Exophiala xenobiotica]|uniref:Uncharacterized protein n=1 Tax=Vermiconidia calcicola TaxID=1690605 RepID=A0AAV9QF14_9PEZI|nr:hypothetical protein H2202_006196 [Exophiala xenobiotica]KAK5539023.1 hypothetical protein LTR25_004567 [Vermiconidia calcicola]KAK5547234.1 hypothetical protein LTR23_002873 [Chaetothyriales sp. CCFEE 6169]KAK5190725.1 hypothetical protein LTR92_009378 [Exophiala xenobiotica]KAK5212436.1 hypothetical protein LTR41_001382 [Exophiala xenobiotica]
MSDSPITNAPVGPQERPILDKLVLVRDKLLLLKQDKSTYVKSSDVLPLYELVIEQVSILNDVRGPEHLVQNRVDTVLDDCLQLVSLFFMAVGRNNEAPALYAMTGNIMRLCHHLNEAAFYSKKDLTSLENTLQKMQVSMEHGKDVYSDHLLRRIQYRLEICKAMLKELSDFLSTLSPEMVPVWEKLVSILRAIAALNTRSKYVQKDLEDLRGELRAVTATMTDGKLPDKTGVTSSGQDLVVPLLNRCLKFTDMVEERQGKIDERFKDVYDKLLEIRNQLERLTMTQAWSLRETDLFMWQRKLDRIDDSRRDGNFFDAEGHPADLHAQRTLLYLIRRGYAYIYQLLIASEPVSEALLPIYNQLLTLRRCLVEVKKAGGVSNPRELYPYSMKLNSIDNMRVDGKFQIGKDIPEGQGAVNDLLAECYDLAYELRTAAEQENGDD